MSDEIDLSQIECLHRKRLLAFFNHFLSRSVTFLNDFSAECQEKLDKMASKLDQMENTLTLLEVKVNSVRCIEQEVKN